MFERARRAALLPWAVLFVLLATIVAPVVRGMHTRGSSPVADVQVQQHLHLPVQEPIHVPEQLPPPPPLVLGLDPANDNVLNDEEHAGLLEFMQAIQEEDRDARTPSPPPARQALNTPASPSLMSSQATHSPLKKTQWDTAIDLQHHLPSHAEMRFHMHCHTLIQGPFSSPTVAFMVDACAKGEEDRRVRRPVPHVTVPLEPQRPPISFVTTATVRAILYCDADALRWIIERALLPPGQRLLMNRHALTRLLDSAFRFDCGPIVSDLLLRYSTLGLNGDDDYRPLIHAIRYSSESTRVLRGIMKQSAQQFVDVNAQQTHIDDLGAADWLFEHPLTGQKTITALAMAVLKSRPDLVHELLEQGANIMVGEGLAWRVALYSNKLDSAQVLLDHMNPEFGTQLVCMGMYSSAIKNPERFSAAMQWLFIRCRERSPQKAIEMILSAISLGHTWLLELLMGIDFAETSDKIPSPTTANNGVTRNV